MLARLNVRNKLLVILLPLLIAVACLSGIGVADRMGTRDEASTDQQLVATARAGAEVVYRMQIERLDAVARRSGVPSGVVDPQSATDQTAKVLADRLRSLDTNDRLIGGRPAAQLTDGLLRRLDDLGGVRTGVEAGTSTAAGALQGYTDIIEGVVTGTSQLLAAADTGREVGGSARWLMQSAEADAASGAQAMIVTAAKRDGRLAEAGDQVAALEEQRGISASWMSVFLADAGPEARAAYDAVIVDPAFLAGQGYFGQLAEIDPKVGLPDNIDWLKVTIDRLGVLWKAQQQIIDGQIREAGLLVGDLEQQIRFYVGGATAALLLGLLLAASVTRVITSSVARLTAGARTISTVSLPRLVDSLRRPEAESHLTVTPIAVKGSDEFAELAAAFSAVEQTAIDVAVEQTATLRKGIGEIFVNLARRNQSLLDRQIEFIDRLEANEEDPDQLDNLFKLDHLATRMRRNAESLLVLAGSEAPRRRGRAVSMTDVIRVAVGEVEEFARVQLLAVDEAQAVGSAAVDLAHLLSELMENGTQYSPPGQQVEVVGHRSVDGGYVVSITDHGVGMTQDAMHEANDLLEHPPLVGLQLSRSLGFIVVSTLAARHGVRVRLTSGTDGGVTALVELPGSLVSLPDSPESDEPDLISAPSQSAEDEWIDNLPPMPQISSPAAVATAAEPLFRGYEVSSEAPTQTWQTDPLPAANLPAVEALGLEPDPLVAQFGMTVAASGSPAPRPRPEPAPTSVQLAPKVHSAPEPPTRRSASRPNTTPPTMRDLPALPGIVRGSTTPVSTPPTISAPPVGVLDPLLAAAAARPTAPPEFVAADVSVAAAMTPLIAETRIEPPPVPAAPAPPPLPQRTAVAQVREDPSADTARVGASGRSAEEIRSVLSRYRSGLKDGRNQNEAPEETS